MASFITNANERKLADRLRVLLGHSQELKFLVGFFYFSGYQALYEALKEAVEQDPELRLKVLVGLSADTSLGGLLEVAGASGGTIGERIEAFLQDLRQALSHKDLDHPSFPEQARFFLRLLEEGRLEIRKTHEPVHAKLYLFRFKQHGQQLIPQGGSFITGSSNLTHAGLEGQLEFNVEILQYGFPEAERFFDDLWKKAAPLSPEDIQRIGEVVRLESLAAEPTPLEVYALLLRRYLDVLEGRPGREGPADLLEKAGFTPYRYQLDAVEMLLSSLEAHGGAILADVVGLGKTAVAALAGRELGRRGIVIAPPHLIGEEGSYGWKDYLEKFGLYDWRAFSTGKLEDALDFVQNRGRDVELVVVDEAHRFRNLETKDYARLSAITRGRKVLLLTATPINNRPRDAYALLQLFVPSGASSLGPERRLDTLFERLDQRFQRASYALRYLESRERDKRKRAERYYKELVKRELPPLQEAKKDLERVLEEIARRTRRVLEPVTVRRNRKDLQEDPRYRREAPPFPKVHDPEPLFYELTGEQNAFYDWLLKAFGPDGEFRGAAYQPVAYFLQAQGKDLEDESLSEEESFALESQKNLAAFMRRLLVRRLESSFGAFAETMDRLASLHEKLLRFAQSTGYYLLNRDLLEWLLEQMEEGLFDEEVLLNVLDSLIEEEERVILRGERKRKRIYSKEDFGAGWPVFLKDLEEDLAILNQAVVRAAELRIADPGVDPKARELKRFLEEALEDPRRKVVVFSEFTDTIAHLEKALEGSGIPFIAVGKKYSRHQLEEVVRNFDPKANPKEDEYRVLLASDRLSEGVNLHRADTVVNYDIPWNPTRLIQRLGRVNRVGGEHQEVHLYHFFPTARGKQVVDPSAVAANKLFLIHKALGEDAKILSPGEEPTPSGIYARLLQLPEEEEPLSLETWARREWEALIQAYPDLEKSVQRLPNRVKTGMVGERDLALVVARKGLAFFARALEKGREDEAPQDLFLEEVFGLLAKAKEGAERLEPEEWFHQAYQKLSQSLENDREASPSFAPGSLEYRAVSNLRTAKRLYKDRLSEEELSFIDALERELKYRGGPRYAVRLLQRADLGNEEALPAFREDLKAVRRLLPDAGKGLEGASPQVDLLVGVQVQKGEQTESFN